MFLNAKDVGLENIFSMPLLLHRACYRLKFLYFNRISCTKRAVKDRDSLDTKVLIYLEYSPNQFKDSSPPIPNNVKINGCVFTKTSKTCAFIHMLG